MDKTANFLRTSSGSPLIAALLFDLHMGDRQPTLNKQDPKVEHR